MTVGELLKELEKYDTENQVCIFDSYEGDYSFLIIDIYNEGNQVIIEIE